MTTEERQRLAMAAVSAVLAGGRAGDAENDVVDFKEEAGTRDRGGARQAIGPQHEPAARALASEVACLANGERGGVLVVGVDDHQAGPAAIVGAYSDPAWLRLRIHALTQPNYTVQIQPIDVNGVTLLLIDVPPALELIRSGGKLRGRVGTACVELGPDRAADLLDRRRGYDWSAQPSGFRFRQAVPSALRSARRKYEAARGLAPESDLELCRRMGVVVVPGVGAVGADPHADPADPELNNAGALLLCASHPDVEQLVVLVAPADGVPSSESVRGPAPLLDLFDEAWLMLTERAFPAKQTVVGQSRRLIRALPDLALREVLVNALMHRDHRLQQRSVLAHALGGDTFRVRSPGGFVPGVRPDRLITSPSVTRNGKLAGALRAIGLAEREGVGVDMIYTAMLRAGYPPPTIVEDGGDVLVTLRGGAPDVGLVSFFEELATLDPALDGVRSAMALTSLLERTPLRAERLAEVAQCTTDEAQDTLTRLERAAVLVRMVNGARAFRLAPATYDRFASRIQYPTRRRLEEHLDVVRAFLDSAPEIGRDDAAALLDVAPQSASRILSELAREGSLEPVSNARGPGVRYRLSGQG